MHNSLLTQINKIKNRKDAIELTKEAIDHPEVLSQLMDLFFSDDLRICQKASWPVTLISDRHSALLHPYLPQMIEHLEAPHHDALIRNTIRTWQTMTIPEEYEGVVYDICFGYLNDPSYAIAIRVFSMTVCTKIALRYTDLITELISVIEEYMPYGSAGFKSRGGKLLSQLRKRLAESE